MTVLPGARNRESGWQMMRLAVAASQPWGDIYSAGVNWL
jgi:hypothetical protein